MCPEEERKRTEWLPGKSRDTESEVKADQGLFLPKLLFGHDVSSLQKGPG